MSRARRRARRPRRSERSGAWLLALLAWTAAACRTPPEPPYRPPATRVRYRTHVVQHGETLYRIGRKYGVSVEALMKLNRIGDPTVLSVGERLLIPASDGAQPADASERPPDAAEPRQPSGDGVRPSDGVPPGFRLPPPPPPSCRQAWDAPESAPRSRQGYLWPVDGVVLVRFGREDGESQQGLDIGAPHGAPVWAARAGIVVFAGEQPGFGRMIILRHGAGDFTLYGRNAEHCVREGDRVSAGQLLARVGDQDGTGVPYLYFEVRQDRRPVDPQKLLPP